MIKLDILSKIKQSLMSGMFLSVIAFIVLLSMAIISIFLIYFVLNIIGMFD